MAATERPRPALFAAFTDIASLRYDYPVVLVPSQDERPAIAALSGIVDELLATAAPAGPAGERVRRSVRRLEREIRAMISCGARGTLSEMWASAADRLSAHGGAPLVQDLARARAALTQDGLVLECDAAMPAHAITHLWRLEQDRKARAMRRTIDGLALRLGDLVKADHLRSGGGREAAGLRAGVGTPHGDLFDFTLMAALLVRPSGAHALSDGRRARIARTLALLRGQRFFAADDPFVFVFDRVDDALLAYRERTDAMVDLMRAIAVAELELLGSYVEGKHDEYFDALDASALAPEDLALFPDYLIRLSTGVSDSEGPVRLIEGLTSGAPLKILCVTDDAFGLGARLATMALGLGDVFVVQASAARLYGAQDRARAALRFAGPALLSVFAPATPMPSGVPPYLVAAAATESRAFPTFSYDPAAGTGWADRFSLGDDPQPERPWPEHELRYADDGLQRKVETVAFTVADFALCDERRARGITFIPAERRGERAVPIASWLDDPVAGTVPFVYAIGRDGGLLRARVSAEVARETRSAAEAWCRLRELGALGRSAAATSAPAPAAIDEPTAVAPAAPAVDDAPAAAPDEPYIETPRCATCNECTNLNPRMFAYNENKQAYIKDVAAGTFRELVEAAEACQVAIIHPGRPRDAKEPGLADLVTRAELFA